MAWLSKIKKDAGLHGAIIEDISKCTSCGKAISVGGMWSFNKNTNIAICSKCAPVLLDLYIDSMQDSGEFTDLSDVEIIHRLSDECMTRYIRKVRKKEALNGKCPF